MCSSCLFKLVSLTIHIPCSNSIAWKLQNTVANIDFKDEKALIIVSSVGLYNYHYSSKYNWNNWKNLLELVKMSISMLKMSSLYLFKLIWSHHLLMLSSIRIALKLQNTVANIDFKTIIAMCISLMCWFVNLSIFKYILLKRLKKLYKTLWDGF